ncbi:uncharacterized protein WM277_003149 isoform 2-T2 [Molossus nigricans]
MARSPAEDQRGFVASEQGASQSAGRGRRPGCFLHSSPQWPRDRWGLQGTGKGVPGPGSRQSRSFASREPRPPGLSAPWLPAHAPHLKPEPLQLPVHLRHKPGQPRTNLNDSSGHIETVRRDSISHCRHLSIRMVTFQGVDSRTWSEATALDGTALNIPDAVLGLRQIPGEPFTGDVAF